MDNTTFLILAGLPLIVGGGLLALLLFLARAMPGSAKPKKAAETQAIVVPARGPEYVRLTAKRIMAYRRGIAVLLGLGVLTALEFTLAQVTGSLVLMFIIGLGKAALILQYFMHIASVWSTEEAH